MKKRRIEEYNLWKQENPMSRHIFFAKAQTRIHTIIWVFTFRAKTALTNMFSAYGHLKPTAYLFAAISTAGAIPCRWKRTKIRAFGKLKYGALSAWRVADINIKSQAKTAHI